MHEVVGSTRAGCCFLEEWDGGLREGLRGGQLRDMLSVRLTSDDLVMSWSGCAEWRGEEECERVGGMGNRELCPTADMCPMI